MIAKQVKPSTPAKPVAKKSPTPKARDSTRSARARRHLERLEDSKGKRLLVDLDEKSAQTLEALKEHGYGDTYRAIVCRALLDAARAGKLIPASKLRLKKSEST